MGTVICTDGLATASHSAAFKAVCHHQPLGVVYTAQEPEPPHIDSLDRPVASFLGDEMIEFDIDISPLRGQKHPSTILIINFFNEVNNEYLKCV